MSYLAVAFGIGLLVLGLYGFAKPRRLLDRVRSLESPGGLLLAAGIRLSFAVVIWLAAPTSKLPVAMQALAAVAAFASLVLPLLGEERFASVVESWARTPLPVFRASLVLAMGLGAFVVWTAAPA